jgi:antitoxin (DNA-binding transcriptional repressor) of toxin-antitoxin stability system
MMRSVGIRTLKNKLSSYIRLASEGETILVTDRDRVVAEITAPRPGRGESLTDAALADAVRNGWVTPAVIRHPVMPRQPVASLRDILDDLDAGRSER